MVMGRHVYKAALSGLHSESCCAILWLPLTNTVTMSRDRQAAQVGRQHRWARKRGTDCVDPSKGRTVKKKTSQPETVRKRERESRQVSLETRALISMKLEP